nr:hypothetical protein [Tanacetum cinerariifolium]
VVAASASLHINLGSQRSFLDDLGVIDITLIDVEEGDASDSGLHSMLDDDLESLTGFDSLDFAEHDFKEGTDALHASADLQAQSDPLGHLHEELCKHNTKFD